METWCGAKRTTVVAGDKCRWNFAVDVLKEKYLLIFRAGKERLRRACFFFFQPEELPLRVNCVNPKVT